MVPPTEVRATHLISVTTHSMLLTLEVNGAATDASASDNEMPE